MSKTPLTDAEYARVCELGCLPGCDSYAHEEMCGNVNPDRVMAEFARSLESRLSEVEAVLRDERSSREADAIYADSQRHRIESLEAALKELVRLKKLKDKIEARRALMPNVPLREQAELHDWIEHYERCKPLAWAEACRVLGDA